MAEELGGLAKTVVERVKGVDRRVFRWSQERAETNRQKKLEEFMASAEIELSGSGDFELVKKYAETRARYRQLLPLLHESSPSPGSPSRWADEEGNEVEHRYHELAQEIRAEHPSLLPKIDKIDSLLPFH